jgi:hypothetical protein
LGKWISCDGRVYPQGRSVCLGIDSSTQTVLPGNTRASGFFPLRMMGISLDLGWIERMGKAPTVRSMSKNGGSPDNPVCEGFLDEMFPQSLVVLGIPLGFRFPP